MEALDDNRMLRRKRRVGKAAARREEEEEEAAQEDHYAQQKQAERLGRAGEVISVEINDDDDQEEGNADLSLGILAKLNSRPAAAASSFSALRSISTPSPSLDGQAQQQHELGFQSVSSGEVDGVAETEAPEEGQIVNDEDERFSIGVPESLANLLANEKKKKKKKKKGFSLTPMRNDLKFENLESDLVNLMPDGLKSENAKTPSEARTPSEAQTTEGSASIVMQKLLRGPRYFDPPEEQQKTCYNCGNVGHMAVDCPEGPRSKPCYVCGKFGHEGRECPQRLECYICGNSGHFAKACPQKGKMGVGQQDELICLHCGEIGHDAVGCWKDYSVEDLQAIRCYVCKQYGHLCCVDVVAMSHTEVSCYNCGEMGHTGMGCAKSRGPTKNTEKAAQVCYKCGEEGHFARGCSKRDQGLDENPFAREAHELPRWTQTPSGLLNMGTTPKQIARWNQDYPFETYASTGGSQSRKKARRNNEEENFLRRDQRHNNSQLHQVHQFFEEAPHENNRSLPRWFTMVNDSYETNGHVNTRYPKETFKTPSHKRWRT